jgi:hypothetical protein
LKIGPDLRSSIQFSDHVTRGEKWASDLIAKQAVAYADALIQALEAIAPKASDLSGET